MNKENNNRINNLLIQIELITPKNRAKWGKMNVCEMMHHCSLFIDLYSGKIKTPKWYKIFGKTIGVVFLWYISKIDPKKTPKNLRTDQRIKVENGKLGFEFEKQQLLRKINELIHLTEFINHPIYGKMKREKVIFLIWHHTMHHLNQFDSRIN